MQEKPAGTTPKARILYVEDDPEHNSGLRDYLVEEGYEVLMTAEKGVTERLRQEAFDLVLLDVMIERDGLDEFNQPVENVSYDGVPWIQTGLELLKRLREGLYLGPGGTPGSVPVILISAVANDSAEEDEELVAMADRYVEKPFRLGALQAVIDELLERAA